MNFQILQIAGVQTMLWPTAISNFLEMFNFINFQMNFIYGKYVTVGTSYPQINNYFTNYGYASYIYLYNFADVIVFMVLFFAMIPVFYIFKRFVFKDV